MKTRFLLMSCMFAILAGGPVALSQGTGTTPCPCKQGPFYYDNTQDQYLIEGGIVIHAKACDACPDTSPDHEWGFDSAADYSFIATCGSSVLGLNMRPDGVNASDSNSNAVGQASADAGEDIISAHATQNSFGATVNGLVKHSVGAAVKCPGSACASAAADSSSDVHIKVPVNLCEDTWVYLDAVAWVVGNCPDATCAKDPVLYGDFQLDQHSGTLQLWGTGIDRDTRNFLLQAGSYELIYNLRTDNMLSVKATCQPGPESDSEQCSQLHSYFVNVGLVPPGPIDLPETDCNDNGIDDSQEINLGTGGASDINNNGILDECEYDCNNNGIPDDYEIQRVPSRDSDNNGRLDVCETNCP